MTEYTNEQIMEYRRIWTDFLMEPTTEKGTAVLDRGDGRRCCLGHACFILGLPVTVRGDGKIEYLGDTLYAPKELVAMLGLHDYRGATLTAGSLFAHFPDIIVWNGGTNDNQLAVLNDDTDATPQMIGAYLKSVIDGGDNTPFRKLN